MPRYATFILLACILGAAWSEDDHVSEPGHRCVCKPTMTMETPASAAGGGVCNNVTVDWLLQTVMGQMSHLNDQLDGQEKLIDSLNSELAGKDAQLQSQQQQLTEKSDKINKMREKRQEIIKANNKGVEKLENQTKTLQEENRELRKEVEWLKVAHAKVHVRPKDCADVQNYGFHYSGVYSVYPDKAGEYSKEGIEVFCDLNTDHGGWTVFQRRQDGSFDFAQDWEAYKHGFGKIAREFWLGNEKLYYLLKQRTYEMRVDMTDFKGSVHFASYKLFGVEDEANYYKLHVGEFSGNAGDALKAHDKAAFSTTDNDHDKSNSGNCAQLYGGGGWWYDRCYDCNLNGKYGNQQLHETVVWWHLHKDHTPLRHVEMKIRPVGFAIEHFDKE